MLTAILIEDHLNGGYTAFLEEISGVIAEGDTKEEALSRLFLALKAILYVRKKREGKKISLNFDMGKTEFYPVHLQVV